MMALAPRDAAVSAARVERIPESHCQPAVRVALASGRRVSEPALEEQRVVPLESLALVRAQECGAVSPGQMSPAAAIDWPVPFGPRRRSAGRAADFAAHKLARSALSAKSTQHVRLYFFETSKASSGSRLRVWIGRHWNPAATR